MAWNDGTRRLDRKELLTWTPPSNLPQPVRKGLAERVIHRLRTGMLPSAASDVRWTDGKQNLSTGNLVMEPDWWAGVDAGSFTHYATLWASNEVKLYVIDPITQVITKVEFRGVRLEPTALADVLRDDSPPPPASDLGQPGRATAPLRNQGPQSTAPEFPALAGEFEVNYRDHDRRVVIGQGRSRFETAWSPSGSGSIHVYNDPPSIEAVAVAPGVSSIDEVSPAVFERANFSSRSRVPHEGQVVLFINDNNIAAAMEIRRVVYGRDGFEDALLKARYRILPDGSRDFTTAPDPLEEVRQAATEALQALGKVQPITEEEPLPGAIGHNGPPPEAALSAEDYQAVQQALVELRSLTAPFQVAAVRPQLVGTLQDTQTKVSRWVAETAIAVRDGAYREVGAKVADAALSTSLWANFLGRLMRLVEKLGALLPPG